MRKGVTLLETLIVLFLAGIIMPFLFKMISTTFEIVSSELSSRQGLKGDLSFVLENDKKYIKEFSEAEETTENYFIKEGKIVKRLVILGEGK